MKRASGPGAGSRLPAVPRAGAGPRRGGHRGPHGKRWLWGALGSFGGCSGMGLAPDGPSCRDKDALGDRCPMVCSPFMRHWSPPMCCQVGKLRHRGSLSPSFPSCPHCFICCTLWHRCFGVIGVWIPWVPPPAPNPIPGELKLPDLPSTLWVFFPQGTHVWVPVMVLCIS